MKKNLPLIIGAAAVIYAIMKYKNNLTSAGANNSSIAPPQQQQQRIKQNLKLTSLKQRKQPGDVSGVIY